MTKKQQKNIQLTDVYLARDNINRVWAVPKEDVKEDYVGFLVQEDNLSRYEATKIVEESGFDFWWHEQWVPYPSMVMNGGFIWKEISSKEKEAALRRYGGRYMESEEG